MPTFLSKSGGTSCHKCDVRFLEETEIIQLEFQTNDKGKSLLDRVCDEINLVEKDYFGLRYVDIDKERHWLDISKSILKQVRDIDPVIFSFRVKFYPPNPFQLKECITRYQIYLQVKKDLFHGRLHCDPNTAAILGAYIIQAELGDYDPDEHSGNYVSEFKILPKQTPATEREIMEIHQLELKGHLPEEMEASFLRKASILDSYGIDPHPVKDQRGTQLYLGVNYSGILTFQGTRKVNHFRWNEVQKLNYEGKMFIIHTIYFERKQTFGFKCPTNASCRHVWRCTIEQMLFFTAPSSSNMRTISGGSFFSFGSKFKYSGRVEREVLDEMEKFLREEPPINRIGSLKRRASSVPATPSTPVVADMGYNTIPRSNYSIDSRYNIALGDELSIHFNPDGTSILERVDEDSECNMSQFNRHKASAEVDSNNSRYSSADLIINGDVVDGVTDESSNDDDGINFKGTVSDSALLYSRDVLNHSSSESQIPPGSASHRSSRSQTPIGRSTASSSYLPGQQVVIPSAADWDRSRDQWQQQRAVDDDDDDDDDDSCRGQLRWWCGQIRLIVESCLPSIILTLASLLTVITIIFETDYEIFAMLRRAPEMVFIRREYYEPSKEHLMSMFRYVYDKLLSARQLLPISKIDP